MVSLSLATSPPLTPRMATFGIKAALTVMTDTFFNLASKYLVGHESHQGRKRDFKTMLSSLKITNSV